MSLDLGCQFREKVTEPKKCHVLKLYSLKNPTYEIDVLSLRDFTMQSSF